MAEQNNQILLDLFLKKFLFLNFLIFKVNVRVKSSFYVHFRKSVFH